MNIAEAIRIALRSLWANKLRSVLTLLGVVIGMAAVIAVVTFVSGIQDYVATKIFNLGADVFIIAKMSPVETNVEHFLVAEKRKNLTLEDYQAVVEACRHCDYVGAMARGSGRVKHNEQSISDTTIQAINEARVAMRAQRHDRVGEEDSFEIETNASLLSIWSGLSDTFFMATIGIAGVSLVVGGIVIMNIMLVSVTERTREIGIRKALGARRDDVLMQFLIEAVILELIGGILGVLSGVGVAEFVTLLIGMPSAIKLWAVGAGLLGSARVGVFFGVYPARKSARLDPIVAFRFEM